MIVLKLALVAIAFAIIIVYLLGVNKEIALVSLVAACGIMLVYVAEVLGDALGLFSSIAAAGGINGSVLKVVVKITLLCYVSEFAIGLIEDFGLKSLADKLSIATKIMIVVTAAPIISSLIDVVSSFAV